MADCCSVTQTQPANPNKRYCPENGAACTEVTAKTISHHIKHAWNWHQAGVRYFFCADPDCDIVYFGDDNSTIKKSQMRMPVGIKEASDDTLVCYCFGISKADAKKDPSIRDYVVNQTKHAQCTCEVSNPSGRCCLKDFPRPNQ